MKKNKTVKKRIHTLLISAIIMLCVAISNFSYGRKNLVFTAKDVKYLARILSAEKNLKKDEAEALATVGRNLLYNYDNKENAPLTVQDLPKRGGLKRPSLFYTDIAYNAAYKVLMLEKYCLPEYVTYVSKEQKSLMLYGEWVVNVGRYSFYGWKRH